MNLMRIALAPFLVLAALTLTLAAPADLTAPASTFTAGQRVDVLAGLLDTADVGEDAT